MTDEEREAAAMERYEIAAHGMQSATAMQISRLGENGVAADAKHLRVGVNSAMVDSGSLAQLLIKKGVITSVEYLEALADGMEREHRVRTAETRQKCNLPDTVSFG